MRYDVRGYELALPNGRYRVTLQFNEPFYDAAGKRVFGVTLQGRTVVDRLDIFARAGKNKALDFSFDDVEVTDGSLKIGFLKDMSSQLIGADKQEAEGKYIEFPCIAGIVAAGPEKTIKVNCGGPAWKDYVADPGMMQTPRYLPADEFYLDWARHQFGEDGCPGGGEDLRPHRWPFANTRALLSRRHRDQQCALEQRFRQSMASWTNWRRCGRGFTAPATRPVLSGGSGGSSICGR